jgi:branched-chain amino acid transport system permease protein
MKKRLLTILIWIVALTALVVFFNNSNTYVQSVINQLLCNIILVLGLNFITGLTGQMNLATAGMLALGAYTYGILTTSAGWNPWVALFAMLAVGLAVGRGLGYPSLRLKGFYLSLTTIGFAEIVRLLATNLPNLTGGVNGLNYIKRLEAFFYKSNVKGDYFAILLVFTILATLIAYKIVNSKWGRAYKAIRDNVEAAEASGIDIARLKIQAFTLSSIYSAIAGALYAGYNIYINPTSFTIAASQNYVAMLMIGGIGSVPGNILGATIVTVLPEFLRKYQDYYWILFCTICLVMAILVPDGLYPLIKKLFLRIIKKFNGKKVTREG